MSRIEDLIAEVGPAIPHRMITQSIDIIVHIRRTRTGRVVDDLLPLES
ncbi:hypothetical protein [Brevundimonas sp. UBA5718]|nr:hypothetical protein [Brevundimonas sp. UBA5718]